MKVLVLFFLLSPSFAFAAMPVLSFKSVQCSLSVDEKVVKTTESVPLMTLMVDDAIARFAQIQFGDAERKIQYQLLIEDDVKTKDAVLVLQNLMVGDLESSAEFSAKEPTWVRVRQGAYSVSCEVNK